MFTGPERELLTQALSTVPLGLADAFPSFVATAVFIAIAPLTRSSWQVSGGGVCTHVRERHCLSPGHPWAHGLRGEPEQDTADLPGLPSMRKHQEEEHGTVQGEGQGAR